VAALLLSALMGPSRAPWLLFPTACWRVWHGLVAGAIRGSWCSPGSGPADRQRRFLVRWRCSSLLLGENLWC